MQFLLSLSSQNVTRGIESTFQEKFHMPCARVLFFLSFKLSFIDPQIKAPTLFFLGADDVRVPPKQGTNFHRLLKANGVETR